MFAVRPSYRELAIALPVVALCVVLAMPTPQVPLPAIMPDPALEEPGVGAQPALPECEGVTNVVIRGWLTARLAADPQFSISFPGKRFQYSAISNAGYFEVRIPVDDFDGDVCTAPTDWDTFDDGQTTVRLRLDLEH